MAGVPKVNKLRRGMSSLLVVFVHSVKVSANAFTGEEI